MQIKRIIKEATILSMIEVLFLSSIISPLGAEENLFGNGYRDYLNNKIRNGYSLDIFMNLDRGQKEKIAKMKQIEALVEASRGANADFERGLQDNGQETLQSSQLLQNEVAQQRQQREQNAAASGEFQYIAYSDGKKAYFTDGLVTTTENERVIDEFGNVSIKNTYNIQYNDFRLMNSYNAVVRDHLGNTSRIFWYGAQYTSDSLFYGGKDTVANRTLSAYQMREIDAAGNERFTTWQAIEVDGKFLRAFHQRIEDTIYGITDFTRSNITYNGNNPDQVLSYDEKGVGTDGLAYETTRTNISYNEKDQMTGYHDETYTIQIDGFKTKTIVDAKFKYLQVGTQFGPDVEEPDPDRLLESFITTTTEGVDGSTRTETNYVNYEYLNNQLDKASGHSSFTGQQPRWWDYRDEQGHVLSRSEDRDGTVSYSYIDPATLRVVMVNPNAVKATLKDGNKYQGNTQTIYEIIAGTAMVKQTVSSVSYYGQNMHPDELQQIEETTLNYNNALVTYTTAAGVQFKRLQALDNQEHTLIRDPLRDPDGAHSTTTDIATTYIRNALGNLSDTYGKGSAAGFEYSNTSGWYGQYTSSIDVEYEVILGKEKQNYYKEIKDYER